MKKCTIVALILLQVIVFGNKPVVLVTGGAGYIGSHACKALYDEGFTPVDYDSLVYGAKKAVKWGPFVEGEFNDFSKLDETFE